MLSVDGDSFEKAKQIYTYTKTFTLPIKSIHVVRLPYKYDNNIFIKINLAAVTTAQLPL